MTPQIRTRPVPVCPICGREGNLAWTGLRDQLFGVSGEWSFRRCGSRACGLLWLDPMPLAADLPLLYQSYFTHAPQVKTSGLRARVEHRLMEGVLQDRLGYDKGLPWWIAFLLSRLAVATPSGADGFLAQAMFLQSPNKGGGRLLEIGCGSGEALARMRDLGWSVLGTDFDPQAVATARGLGLEVRIGGAECVSQADGPFDAIFLGHVIEHVPNVIAALKCMYKKMKKGGELVLVVPDKRYMFDLDRLETPLEHFLADEVRGKVAETLEHYIEYFRRAAKESDFMATALAGHQTGRDIHMHVFTPDSMRILLNYLNDELHLGQYVVLTPAKPDVLQEFYVHITK